MARQLKSLLGSSQELHPLLKKTRELGVLQSHLVSIAPPYLAKSSQVLSLTNGILNVSVANATIAAKLRQLAPELAALLRGRGCEISGIRVKVQVSYNRSEPKPAPRKLGKSAHEALNELSQSLPPDSMLKLALKKMVDAQN
jgi:hypothetical protein